MNTVLILCLLFVVAKAEIPKEYSPVKSERGLGDNDLENSFLHIINPGLSGKIISGRFVYDGEDGQQYDVSYFADAYSYQAQGNLIHPKHPLANLVAKWNTNKRITLKGKLGPISEQEI